jgi:hypothetical protein
MAKVRSWAGLDVHACSVLAASMDSETGESRVRKLSGETSEVVDFCALLPGPTRVAYEAGPTGTVWHGRSWRPAWTLSWRRQGRSSVPPRIA